MICLACSSISWERVNRRILGLVVGRVIIGDCDDKKLMRYGRYEFLDDRLTEGCGLYLDIYLLPRFTLLLETVQVYILFYIS